MPLEKESRVILFNRGMKEFGTITKKWRRKDTWFFNVKTERGVEFQGLTTSCNFPCFINEDLTEQAQRASLQQKQNANLKNDNE